MMLSAGTGLKTENGAATDEGGEGAGPALMT
jgi:hypothetical protein